MLNETHKKIQIPGTSSTYYLGKVGEHIVAVSCASEADKHQEAE
jgi:hypothetical protein